jgi:glutamate/tyrosine decarboxylase-like PLP-dependent enzyme
MQDTGRLTAQDPTAGAGTPSLTLDPADWAALRALGHRMLDDMLDHLTSVRQRPAWTPMPADVKAALSRPLPYEPQGAESAYEDFVRYVRPYPNGNLHPRFWGWVQGNGTPLAMLADMLASGLNPHLAGFNQAPALVEHQVLAWLAELMGMPADTSGLLCSGGTMAGVIGLAVARHARAGFDVRELGLQGHDHPLLTVYGSIETHGWVAKAAELLGLGRRAYRAVGVDDDFRIDVAALRRAIAADRRDGHRPFCVVGTAGTVNAGAVDDLCALADVCAAEGLWFHVDGAFGALARLVPALCDTVAGIERADSLALDLHKWMYLPFDVACVLVRDARVHQAAFAASASYFGPADRGVLAGGLPFADRGIELTRSFKALKVWMSLKAHGVRTFGRLIEQNVHQARHLAALVHDHPDLQLLAPVPLNVVCFRYAPAGLPSECLDALNQEILVRLQESGVAIPSSTWIRDRFAIRVANVNHRSRHEDFDALVRAVAQIGGELVPSTTALTSRATHAPGGRCEPPA